MGLKVRTIFLILFTLVLGLPVLLVGMLRLFEDALVRETEQILTAEAVVVGELFRKLALPESAATPMPSETPDEEDRFHPFRAQLELSHTEPLPPVQRGPRVGTSTLARDVGPALDRVLERAILRNLSGIRVLDTHGVVIATGQGGAGYRLDHLPEVQAALQGDYRPVLRRRYSDQPAPPVSSLSRAAGVRVSLAIPIYADPRAPVGKGAAVIGAVYASRTPLDTTQALWLWRRKLLLPAALALVFTLSVIGALTLAFARPLVELRRFAESVAMGLDVPKHAPTRAAPAEIVALAGAIQQMREQLEARADYVREFAANTAHELKTPLTSIRGAAELLREDSDRMSPEQRARFLQNVEEDALRMDKLVGRILDLARIEMTKPKRERFDLRAYLDGVVERYARHGKTIELVFRAADRSLSAAPEQLDVLITNLLDNAFRHGGAAPVSITVDDAPNAVRFDVRDRGPALPPHHFARVFERFYTTERERGGTGLGLAIVKAVAEAHGGTVSAAALSEGASFVVIIPRVA